MPARGTAARVVAGAALIVLCVGALLSQGQGTGKPTLGGGTQSSKQGLGARDCLGGCHKDFADKYMGLPDVHAVVREKKCESCHLRHGLVTKRVMKKEGNELCYGCHAKDTIGLSKANVHSALKVGSCTLCHNPHASKAAHLLNADVSELCYQCHAKANYEQKVVHKVLQTDGCAACHSSHGSDQPNLLVKEEKALCLGCHPPNTPAFNKAHGGYPVDQASCSGCHSPHSSTQAKLLKTSLHAPVAGAECATCHAAPAPGKPFALNQTGGELCATCHDAASVKGTGKVQHVPFKDGQCLLCHTPHASANPSLLKEKGNAVCTACHKEHEAAVAFTHAPVAAQKGCLSCHRAHSVRQRAAADGRARARSARRAMRRRRRRQTSKSQHAPVVGDECTTCHDAHGSNVKGILKDRMDRLCYGCHADAETGFLKTYTHQPVRDGACSACHQPHGSAEPKLLKGDGAKLCKSCHADLTKPIAGGAKHAPFVDGHVPHLPRPARQQRQGHGRRQYRHALRRLPRRPQGGDGRREVEAPAGDGGRVHGLPQPAPVRAPAAHAREEPRRLPRLPQGAQGGDGRRPGPFAGGARLPPLPPAPRVGRRPPDGQAGADGVRRVPRPETPAFGDAHLQIDPARIRCERCHDAHASKEPHFFKSNAHAPFAMKSCTGLPPSGASEDQVRERRCVRVYDRLRVGGPAPGGVRAGPGPAEPLPPQRPGPEEVCLACHTDFEQTLKKRSVHTPVRAGDCSGCHDPARLVARQAAVARHGRNLRRVPRHADSREREERATRSWPTGQCGKCHDPHASDNPNNLLARGNDLCFGCHKALGESIGRPSSARPGGAGLPDVPRRAWIRPVGHLLKSRAGGVPGLPQAEHAAFLARHMNYPVAKARARRATTRTARTAGVAARRRACAGERRHVQPLPRSGRTPPPRSPPSSRAPSSAGDATPRW